MKIKKISRTDKVSVRVFLRNNMRKNKLKINKA